MDAQLATFAWAAAPLHGLETVALTSLCYVGAALAAKAYCDARPPRTASGPSLLLAAHSAVLCAASLVMCVGAVRAVLQRGEEEGSFAFFFCENDRPAPRLYAWAYFYYVSKYYELLDTFLPVLVHGRVPRHFGMHVFHHGAVLFMAWGYVEYRQTLAFGGLVANTGVHVVMYAYYALADLKLETRWKKYVTYVQILQFSVSFLLLAVSCSGAFGPVRSCSGVRALAGNCAFNAALLYLFFGVLGASTKKRKAA